MTQPPSPDLSTLIHQAEDETRRALRDAAARAPRPDAAPAPSRWLRGASGLAVLTAVLVWAHFLFSGAVSNERIANDLRVLLQQAQGQVESHVQQTGQLPPILPDPTLATVVRYEITDGAAVPPRYVLRAEIRGVQASGPLAEAGAAR